MSNESKITRVKELIRDLNLKQVEFAEKIGTDPSNFSKVINGKLPISESLINKIVIAFGVNKEYLMTGEGSQRNLPMSQLQSRCISLSPNDILPTEHKGTKIYDIDVTAGNLGRELLFTQEYTIGSIDIPYINHHSHIVKVSGDSMMPTICNGDMIAIRKIRNSDLIYWGQIYVVVLDDYRMVKCLRKHENPKMVILRSENKDYDDIEIYRDKIHTLFIVENIIRIDNRL